VAREALLQALEKRGFQVRKKEVHLPAAGLRRGPVVDVVMERQRRQFAVEIKVARELADWLFQWLARPILVLQAAHRLEGWHPLLALYVEALDPRGVRRFKAQAALYAPGLWWLMLDSRGNVAAHLPGGDEETIGSGLENAAARASRAWRSRSDLSRPSYSSARLSFGDLDQWLLKVLLFGRAQGAEWGGPQGAIRTLADLAKLAAVAPPLVYRWAAAMERAGYLAKARGRVPVLQEGERLLAEWHGRYRISDNESLACAPVFSERIDGKFVAAFLDRLRHLPAAAPAVALTGHQACGLYRLKHSDARSIHLYVSGDPSALLDHLQVAPSASGTAPIVLLRPRYPRSALGGVSRLDGVPVCDPLQAYLDLYHLADRGREQAEVVEERILAAVLRQAAEAPHDL
jgi:hypothetical protein